MSERKWTENQQKAIDTRDRTLLVSAAAGSGKTATLTERIIRSLLDENDPVNIEQMLIVTYTRAAVGELTERIGKAIKSAMKADPSNARLERQLHMLPSARISTIDSFCADILRANAERVGISPSFRVPDQAEVRLLAEGILDSLIGSAYEGEVPEVATPEEMDMLSDCLVQSKKDSELAGIIMLIYSSTESSLLGVGSVGELVREYDPEHFTSVDKTGFGKYCMARLGELLSHYLKTFIDIKRELSDYDEKKSKKVIAMVDDALSLISSLRDAKGYSDVREILSGYEFARAASVYPDMPPVGIIRRNFKDEITELYNKFFMYSEEDWRVAYTGLYAQFSVFYRLILEFDKRFRAEKLRRGMCEFSDIERYTYELLWQDGEKTDIAISEAKQYRTVYIDEYQDVNSLQNKIFEAISTESNRFMVGDIKQSIYEFRSADPQIFAGMKSSFPELGKEGDYPAASIFMSDNFRCDKGIIDFVNHIFDPVFTHLKRSIGYVDADRLNFSKLYDGEAPEYKYPEICLVNTFPKADPRSELIEDPRELVSDIVARKIRELLDTGVLDNGERVRPGDIAIIMRKVKSKAPRYQAALERYGIESAATEESRFFMSSDVLLVLSLLNAIDNPLKDVYLAGLMCSPIYGFNVGELALIRKDHPANTLYESLKMCDKDTEVGVRVAKFLEKLAYYRLISEGVPTDKLLLRLYHETGLLALSAASPKSRDNLMLLYEHARSFESGSFRGFYNFINYINMLTGRNNDFDKREAPGECDAVRIITAHGSKGLEYPIVFFTEGDAPFGQSTHIGEAPRFEYEEGFGLGMYLRTPSRLALVANPTKDVIKDYRMRRKIEEEARLLYVILTRAREQLYVVANVGTDPDGFLEGSKAEREYLSEYSIYNTKSFIKMILASRDFEVKSPSEFLKDPPDIYKENWDELFSADDRDAEPTPDTVEKKCCINEPDIGEIAEEYRRRFEFVYPYLHMTTLPGKLSVSRLYPEILDPRDEGAALIDGIDEAEGEKADPYERTDRVPAFLGGKDPRESAKRGIATHMFMQFFDIESLIENGAEGELERLTELGFLSRADKELVRLNEIRRFERSRLLSDMRSAEKIYREFRFNVKLPAEKFTTDPTLLEKYKGECILVQGVIDCLIVDKNGNLRLIDYKTDRLSPEEMRNIALAYNKLRESHSLQLAYYALAVEKMFGKRPSSVEVYSTPLGLTIPINTDTV